MPSSCFELWIMGCLIYLQLICFHIIDKALRLSQMELNNYY